MEKRKVDWIKFWPDLERECKARNLHLMKPQDAMQMYRQLTEGLIEEQLKFKIQIVPNLGNPPEIA